MDALSKPRVVAVGGPTATGKTALSVALAKEFGGEIINADSMQVYKNLNVGTAKPTAEERQGIPHHLLDFLTPETPYSVADFTAAAAQLLTDYGPLSQVPVERYALGRLDELIAEAASVSRVFYLSFPVTIPAGGSVTVTAAGGKSASFDFPGTGGPYEGTQSYELAPTLGSSLAFTSQTARLLRDDDTVLTRDDYGFSATGEAVSLDGRPCYAFTIQ